MPTGWPLSATRAPAGLECTTSTPRNRAGCVSAGTGARPDRTMVDCGFDRTTAAVVAGALFTGVAGNVVVIARRRSGRSAAVASASTGAVGALAATTGALTATTGALTATTGALAATPGGRFDPGAVASATRGGRRPRYRKGMHAQFLGSSDSVGVWRGGPDRGAALQATTRRPEPFERRQSREGSPVCSRHFMRLAFGSSSSAVRLPRHTAPHVSRSTWTSCTNARRTISNVWRSSRSCSKSETRTPDMPARRALAVDPMVALRCE